MKKILFLTLIFVGLGGVHSTYAQNEIDALRYSLMDPTGSARFTGMGGAMGGLGGDMSAITLNPASLGIYRRGEGSITFSVANQDTDAEYNGTLSKNTAADFLIQQGGFVSSYDPADPNWRKLNFSVGYNKLKDFNENITIQGQEMNTTFLDVYALQADGTFAEDMYDAHPFGAGLAWDAYLLDPIDTLGTPQYVTAVPYGALTQRKTIQRTGSNGETYVALAGNLRDELYIGASLGFPSIRFREVANYSESNFDEGIELDSYNVREDLRTTGNGVNIKFGAIYRPNDFVRIGAAWHSPTSLSLTDVYTTTVSSNFRDGDSYIVDSPEGIYEYNIKTPSRVLLDAGFVLGKYGIIGVDYEYVNYSNARLRPGNTLIDDYDFALENGVIDEIYRGTHNLRIGAEARLAKVFRLRGGIAYQQSPFTEEAVMENLDVMTYSGGLGYRKGKFFADVSYQLKDTREEHYLYHPELVNPSILNSSNQEILFSIGLRL